MKILVIALIILLAGCESSVYPMHWERAIKMCEPFGGVKYFRTNMDIWMGALYCKDGTVMTHWRLDPKQRELVWREKNADN